MERPYPRLQVVVDRRSRSSSSHAGRYEFGFPEAAAPVRPFRVDSGRRAARIGRRVPLKAAVDERRAAAAARPHGVATVNWGILDYLD